MSHRFLTLEGAPAKRRSLDLSDFGLGAGIVFTRPPEKRQAWPHDPYRETDEAEAWERAKASREHLFKPADAEEPGKSVFTQYELDGDLGFFKRLKRMVTPPARARKVMARIARPFTPPRAVRNFAGKALRYAGAVNTLPLTAFGGAKLRNKAFGLKGGEVKAFDAAAKVYRAGAIAVASIAGGAAIVSAMSPSAAGAFTAFAGRGKAGLGFLMKGGSAILKDPANNAVWKLAANSAGVILASKLARQSVGAEEYAALPDYQPVPVGAMNDAQDSPPMPPTVAGSGSMAPGGEAYTPTLYGQEQPYDPAEVMSQEQAVPFPNALTRDPDGTYADEAQFDDLIAQAQARAQAGHAPEVAPAMNEAAEKPAAEAPAVSEVVRSILEENGGDPTAPPDLAAQAFEDEFERALSLGRQVNDRLRRRAR